MTVYAQKVGSYQPQMVRWALEKGIRSLGTALDQKRTAIIKPNIVRGASPGSGIVTHPVVVEAIIDALRDRGTEDIIIGELSAIGVDTLEAFETSGYNELARNKNVRLADLSTMPARAIPWKYGTLNVPRAILEADLYVNVAKMKTHFHTGVTLSLKNQWGLLPRVVRQRGHQQGLHEAMVELAKVVSPHLVVIDGIEGMEGMGPTNGKKIHSRVLAVGQDMLEVDVACCNLMGMDPHRIKHLEIAYQQGLWNEDPVFVGGDPPRVPTFQPADSGPRKMLNFYAWRNERSCALAEHAFEDAMHLAMHNPRYWFSFMPKFMAHLVFGRLDYIRGPEAEPPEKHGAVLWVCDCSKQFISRNGTVPVPGCPPRPEDILETIARMPLTRAPR